MTDPMHGWFFGAKVEWVTFVRIVREKVHPTLTFGFATTCEAGPQSVRALLKLNKHQLSEFPLGFLH